jgi:hypothetical protein
MGYTIYGRELRIGNWILLDMKTTLPRPHCIMAKDIFDISEGRITLNAIEGLVLTPGILEKAGFEHHYYKAEDEAETDSEWWTIRAGKSLWGKNEITIVKFDEGLKYSCHDTRAECKYVHQLQNLYFALTGEELSIQL